MIIEQSKILDNDQIAHGIFRMTVASEMIAAAHPSPGQFVNICVNDSWEHPLRRPMSIAGLDGERLIIIYKVFGEGTEILAGRQEGETIDILGPLGNSFGNSHGCTPILVGGGVGLAPILWLHERFVSRGIKHSTIIGARSSGEHFHTHAPSDGLFLTTDDGSVGEKGTVIPTLRKICADLSNPRIFACGPEPMLKAVHEYANESKIPGELSVESYMGCATGICQGCVVERATDGSPEHSYHERYSLVCCDGPVYRAEEIVFS